MQSETTKIYEQLAVKGLIGALVQRVRQERPKASRNTIWLAFEEGPTTPTRAMILEKAGEILAEQEQAELHPEPATT